jgi:hypothetical protein
MLGLHEGTLFYFNLRASGNAKKTDEEARMKKWADNVSHATGTAKRPASSTVSKFTSTTMGVSSSTSNTKVVEDFNEPQASALDLMEDEVDTEERNAALSSPPKGRQRLTSAVSLISNTPVKSRIVTFPQGIVKIKDSAKPLEAPKTRVNRPRAFKNDDLPTGSVEGGVWRRVFVPSYIACIASYDDPWTILDNEAVKILQLTFDAVYKGVPSHNVKASGAVHYIVSIY